MITKILTWVAIIVVVVWIVSNPAKAGTDVHNWITSIVSFFTSLANG